MNPKPYTKVFEDKTMLRLLTEGTQIKTPKIYISAIKNIIRSGENNLITLEEAIKELSALHNIKLFIKPSTDSSSEKCIELLFFEMDMMLKQKNH